MAKRKPKFTGTYRKPGVSTGVSLGTLASKIVIVVGAIGVAPDKVRVSSMDAIISVDELTASEGPITVGYAHSDYSVTEIKECIESGAAFDLGDKVAQEKSNRWVRIVGQVSSEEPRLNDGRAIKTKLNWLLAAGDNVNLFAYNLGGAALTTGATVFINGHANVWFSG